MAENGIQWLPALTSRSEMANPRSSSSPPRRSDVVVPGWKAIYRAERVVRLVTSEFRPIRAHVREADSVCGRLSK